MQIDNKPFLFTYENDRQNIITFVVNVQETIQRGVLTYNQFINGLCIGALYTITEINHMMDNGYEWNTIS